MSPTPNPTSQRRYITHVTSNMLGGVDLDLDIRNLIHAPNAHNKSTVTKAVEFAFRGSVTDLMGQDEVANHQVLAELAPEGEELYSTVTMSDGTTQTMTLSSKGPVPSGDAEVGDMSVFTLHDLRELFTRAAVDAQRAWFLGRIAASVTDEAILQHFPEVLRPEFDTVRKAVLVMPQEYPTASRSPVDLLAAVRKEGNRRKLAAGRDATAAQAVVDAVAANAASAPLESDVTAAETEAASLLTAWNALPKPSETATVTTAMNPSALENLRTQLVQAEANLEKSGVVIPGIRTEVHALQQQLTEANDAKAYMDLYDALALVADAQANAVATGAMDRCACCEEPIKDPAHAIAMARQARGVADTGRAKLQGVMAAQKLMVEKQALLKQWEDYVTQWSPWVTTTRLQIASEDARGASDAAAVEANPEVALAWNAARDAWQAADAGAKAARSALDQYAGVHKARNAKARHIEHQDLLKRLVVNCDTVIGAVLDARVDMFLDRVRSHMPAPEKMPKAAKGNTKDEKIGLGGLFGLRLKSKTGSKSFRIGLIRTHRKVGAEIIPLSEPTLQTALSGAEWDIVLAAIATTLSEDMDFSVIIPEDRDIAAETLAEWVRSLAKAPSQILITSTTLPKGYSVKRAPAGWTIIDVSDLQGPDVAVATVVATAGFEVVPPVKDDDEGDDDTDETELPPEPGEDDDDEADPRPKVNPENIPIPMAADAAAVGVNGTPRWAQAALSTDALMTCTLGDLRATFMDGFGEEFLQGKAPVQDVSLNCVWTQCSNGAVVKQMGPNVTVYRGTASME